MEKISSQGQLVPVLARPLKNNTDYSHEIIYGSRRHYVCSSLNKDLKILEGEMENDDALLFMDAENSGREEPSFYEMALAYKNWLDTGVFQNQGELAKKLCISRMWVNKIISLSKIPMEVACVFKNPKDMTLKMALAIVSKLSESREAYDHLFKKAIGLKSLNLDAKILFGMLFDGDKITQEETGILQNNFSLSKTVFSKNGSEVYKLSNSKKGKTTISFSAKYSKEKLELLLKNLEQIAQEI